MNKEYITKCQTCYELERELNKGIGISWEFSTENQADLLKWTHLSVNPTHDVFVEKQ